MNPTMRATVAACLLVIATGAAPAYADARSEAKEQVDFGIDVDTWAFGAGYVFPLKDGIDLYGRVLYLDQNMDAGPANADDDGLGVQGRIRARTTDEFELEGGLQYVDVSDSDISLQASARYNFSDAFSAGIGITFAGDTDGIGINARYSF